MIVDLIARLTSPFTARIAEQIAQSLIIDVTVTLRHREEEEP